MSREQQKGDPQPEANPQQHEEEQGLTEMETTAAPMFSASALTSSSGTGSSSSSGIGIRNTSPIRIALETHQLSATVIDVDIYRVGVGITVETDYIISVQPKAILTTDSVNTIPLDPQAQFEPFTISKPYSSFRVLAHQLKSAAEAAAEYQQERQFTMEIETVKSYCDLVRQLVESQKKTEYIDKVQAANVKKASQFRSRILNEVLEATVQYFPTISSCKHHPFLVQVAALIETFFLTDHCDATTTTTTTTSTTTWNPSTAPWIPSTAPTTANLNHPQHKPKQRSLDSQILLGLVSKPKDIVKKVLNPVMERPASTPATIATASIDSTAASEVEIAAAKDINSKTAPTTATSADVASSHAVVQPLSTRMRRSAAVMRMQDELDWNHNHNQTSTAQALLPKPMRNAGWAVVLVLAAAIIGYLMVFWAGQQVLTIDADAALLALFAAFCLGLHSASKTRHARATAATATHNKSPQSSNELMQQKPKLVHRDASGRLLLQRMSVAIQQLPPDRAVSALAHEEVGGEEEEEDAELDHDDTTTKAETGTTPTSPHMVILGSPMPLFPPNAKIGSVTNCYSEPDPANFQVRGHNYFKDKKKIASDEFLFPTRGIDLFLTDTCPENVGQNAHIFGGNVRTEPTFIINFRLPWGVLIFYFTIPDRFLPFLKAGHDARLKHDLEALHKLKLSLASMSPPERTLARFLMANTAQKNETLKIVPVVVDGPWVVKSVVGGKPAILGNKLPVSYVYQPAEGDKHLYLEADLDIAASSAARGILSVTKSYTQILTLDLGFTVQANEEDELPECMLNGIRIHGVNPLNASSYPDDDNHRIMQEVASGNDDDRSE